MLTSPAGLVSPPALHGLLGLGTRPHPSSSPSAPNPDFRVLVAAPQRRVFYSFHYDDVNRVNLVRNSGKIRTIDRERRKSVFDKSLWERSRTVNPEALKRSIDRALAGTSATCILVGEHTWARPWVRYEIARSLFIRNGIFAVRIDALWCIGTRCYGIAGPNPLDFMALGRDERGRIQIYEYDGYGWVVFEMLSKFLLSWPKWLGPVSRGHCRPLSNGAPIYHYQTESGSDRLLIWAHSAAKMAGK